MLYLLISLLGILITIFFVIGTHEAAHFFAARLLKVKVLRFSIGFGKTLLRCRDKKGTEYIFALIPLGGYVKMLDEREDKVPEEQLPFAFNRQPFYKKFLIVLAGPCMNIFCAFILYWCIFMLGFSDIKPIIGEINPRSIAAESGMTVNQEIIRVDDQKTSTWTGILFRILVHAGNQDRLHITTRDLKNNELHRYVLDLSTWHLDNLTPDPLTSLGIKPYQPSVPLIIGLIAPDSPAAKSMLKIGDKIIAIHHSKINSWDQVIKLTTSHPEQTLEFTLERQGKTLNIPVTIGYQRDMLLQKQGYLGIAPTFKWPDELISRIQYGPLAALPHAFQQIVDFTYFNLVLFEKIFTGKISLQSLGGPITIFESAGEAFHYGLLAFLGFLAFLSISVGIINILPIPGLDGGHLFVQIIELIIRRPIPERLMLFLYYFGFLLIMFVFVQALVNDILRLY